MNGNVYEIELLKNYGYGYVQILVTSEFGLDSYILVRTLSHFSKHPFNGDVSFFEEIDELIYPSIMLVPPKIKGKNKWRLIDNLHAPFDYRIPKFKDDPTTESWETLNWDNISWCVLTNLVANGLDCGYKFHQVKHLPFWRHCSPVIFKIKLTMFWIKKNNHEIKDFFDLDEDYNYLTIYNEVSNSVFYSNLDKNIRTIPQ